MKGKTVFLVILLWALLLSGCGLAGKEQQQTAERETFAWQSGASSPVPEERILGYRRGVSQNFILTENGFYCLKAGKDGCYALYCDLDSDRFVKLCSRPDCPHNSDTCDAYLQFALSEMVYFHNKLYYIRMIEQVLVKNANGNDVAKVEPLRLFCMDIDGRNKQKVTDLFAEEEKITGYKALCLADGYLVFGFFSVDDMGNIIKPIRYTNLDHPGITVETPMSGKFPQVQERIGMNGYFLGQTEDGFIVMDGLSKIQTEEGELYSLYLWNPDENSLEPMGECKSTVGFFGREEEYLLDGNRLIRWNYRTHETEVLLDTKLQGSGFAFYPFPDCFVIGETNELKSDELIDSAKLYFYNWNYEKIDECVVPYHKPGQYMVPVFAETKDRILITGDSYGGLLPEYYIEKSDLGTGHITLHEYRYP